MKRVIELEITKEIYWSVEERFRRLGTREYLFRRADENYHRGEKHSTEMPRREYSMIMNVEEETWYVEEIDLRNDRDNEFVFVLEI